jgi:hypothetical protein
VISKTGTTRNSDSDEPSVDEPHRPQRAETTNLVPGSPVSGMVSMTNNTVLGLSPAMAVAGAYLGMGLASQLGFFSNANQYQSQSMVALAAVVGAVKRKPPTPRNPRDVSPSLMSVEYVPVEPSIKSQDIEDAMKLAEAKMQECEF